MAYLDSWEGSGTGSYWQMLKHAEKNGFDLAVIKPDLMDTFRWGLHDMRQPADQSEERELLLALRHRMRMEMLLPPLTDSERAAWGLRIPAPSRRYRYTGPHVMNGQPKLTAEQIEATVSYIRAHYPDVVRYLRSVAAYNAPLETNEDANDRYIVRAAWHFAFMADALCEVIGDSGEIAISYYEIEERLEGSDWADARTDSQDQGVGIKGRWRSLGAAILRRGTSN